MKANLFILIAGILLSGFSYDFNMLLISRIIQGITFAALAVCLYILVVTQLDEDSISIALGLVSSAGYIAVTSAPVISSWTSYLTSWRISFLLVIIFCIIDYILLFNTELDWHEEKELNMTGSLLYALLMVFFTVGLINLDENWGIVLFGLSIALTVIFIAHEKNSENKIYNLSLLKDRKYVIGNFAAFTSYFTTFILTYIVTLYLEINIKISPQISGLILLITPVVMIFVSPISGRLSLNYDTRILSATGFSILLISVVMFYFIDIIPFEILLAALLIQGIGHGIFSAPNNVFVLTSISEDDLPDASALLTTSKELGKAVSLAVLTIIALFIFENDNLGLYEVDLVLITKRMMIVIIIMLTLCIVLLLISRYYSDDKFNPEMLEKLYSLNPFRR